jgi:hypothetical protein
MDTTYLESITIRFPNDLEFANQLLSLLGMLGRDHGGLFEFTCSSLNYYPKLYLEFGSNTSDVFVDFARSNKQITSIKVENSTGIEKQSPHTYGFVSEDEVARRLTSAGLKLVGIDHLGFNLPWFSSDLHPQISGLRTAFSPQCLYHLYPSGEAWNFILPGDCDEILTRKAIDYTKVRRPKFEMVSFEKASKPLVQIDVSTQTSYEKIAQLFPESLKDPQIGNVWVYLKNRYTIDVCLVINPLSEHDWSDFFKGYRL